MSSIAKAKSVTWMIPVLNGMPYLPVTLASIESQTFHDFDVTVWDNGSTDGTVEELRRWIPDRLPGKIVTDRPVPLGLSRAAMVAECETELCALVDADDVNHPERLEKQVGFMEAHPEVAVLGTQINRLNSAGENLGPFSAYPLVHEEIVEEMLVSNPIAQPSVLFRKSAVLAVGNYHDFSPTHVEDYDLWLRLAAKGYRLANLPESLLGYRVHEKSTTQKSLAAQRLEDEVIRRLGEWSPELFGCDAATTTLLRHRACKRAIIPLREIAAKLGASGSDPWKSPVFYKAARRMIADRDIRSRLHAAMENGGLTGGVSELSRIATSAVRLIRRRLGV